MTTYQPTWDSLTQHETPQWFSDSKFGLYAHWGIYSVPGFGNEWYGKWMNDPSHEIYRLHCQRFGSPADYGYTRFIEGFTAENYDPEDWADLFAASGARYAGFSLAHHDGFGLWDSDVYRWNVGKMGPKRDLYGALASALRQRDLRLVAPFHIIRGFNWFLAGWNQWDQTFDEAAIERGLAEGWELFDPDFADFYWVQQTSRFEDFFTQWQLKVREVIDKYQPDMMWFDGGKFRDDGYEDVALEILAHYLNQARRWGKEVLVLNKLPVSMQYNFHPDFGVINFEKGRDRPAVYDRPWNDDMRIGDQSWGWVENQQYAGGHTLLSKLIDCAARGGTMMLSLSPKPDGTIPADQRQPLLQMGEWLRWNGSAIYNTVPWTTHAEGDEAKLIVERRGHKFWEYDACNADDRRYTQSKDGQTVYAMTLGIPERSVTFGALDVSVPVARVSLLESDQPVQWAQSAAGLAIDTTGVDFKTDLAAAWRVDLS